MSRKGSGRNWNKAALVTGGGLLVGAAVTGLVMARNRRNAAHPELAIDWSQGENPTLDLEQLEHMAAASTDFPGYDHPRFRKHVAVLGVDKARFDSHMRGSKGRAGVAIRTEDGNWIPGVAREGETFGEQTDGAWADKRIAAVRIGAPAVKQAVLGVWDQETFVPFDTEAIEISNFRRVRSDYPQAPVLNQPPVLTT